VIVADSSVWIDYFNGRITPESDRLHDYLGTEDVATGDLILAEVLQGFRREPDARSAGALMSYFPVLEMSNAERATIAAERYRSLRRRGVTVRNTIDVLIASFCVSEEHRLLTSDRDFDPFTEHLGLLRA
jgi:predicted nucleic acid-binding protein